MNKGLDLVQRQMIETIDGYPTGNVYIGLTTEELAELEEELKRYEDFKKIMKDYDLKPSNLRQACIVFRMNKDRLKALELLLDKILDTDGLNEYVDMFFEKCLINEEEYNLLKEVLK